MNSKVGLVPSMMRMEGLIYDVEDEPTEMWELQCSLTKGDTEFHPIRARVNAYIGKDIKEKIKEKEQKQAKVDMGMATAPKKLTKEERYHWNKNNLVGASSNGQQVNKEGMIRAALSSNVSPRLTYSLNRYDRNEIIRRVEREQ